MSWKHTHKLLLAALLAGGAAAEERTPPANPMTRTGVSDEGGLGSRTGMSIRRQPAKPRTVTFVAVTPVREWRDVDGRTIQAALIAFDEEPKPDDGKPAAGEKDKAPPVLVRDGKVRLWVQGAKKFSELALSRLDEEDRIYIRRLEEAARQGGGKPPAEAE